MSYNIYCHQIARFLLGYLETFIILLFVGIFQYMLQKSAAAVEMQPKGSP